MTARSGCPRSTPSSGFAPENGTTTPSEIGLGSVRSEILDRTDLVGTALRRELTDAYDTWLTELLPDVEGIALVAVGGLGRREPTPYSDLDLVLLHTGKVRDISGVANRIWYPIWDSKVGLDHSVRTVDQAVSVAESDLKAMLGLLDLRHIAGDDSLTTQLKTQIVSRWQRTAPNRLTELQELAESRWRSRGDASFLLEPDLKDCRGGLRDWVGLRALASAQLLDITGPVQAASATLLDVRGELHRLAGRATDVLRAQDRAAVAAALGIRGVDDGTGADPAADAVLRRVNEAARTLGFATDHAWRRIRSSAPTPSRAWLRRRRPEAVARRPLAADVVEQSGEVVLARDARPASDPVLPLRVARAAAVADLPISTHTLTRLASECPPLPEPWPEDAREEFVTLLGARAEALAPIEALDQYGLMSRILPEWEHVRFRAQHNPVHRFTVDRHLIETAVQVASAAPDVSRPDLLLVGAFLHDIGKGRPGDHSVVGEGMTRTIALRMGFDTHDAEILAALTRHHLLLPDTATRRDLDDPSTVQIVLAAVGDSKLLLELLHPLTVADAAATGPAAWSDWKGRLVRDLVARAASLLAGEPLPEPAPVPSHLVALAESGRSAVVIKGHQVSFVASDQPGLLSRAAGVLALHSLDIASADVRTAGPGAVMVFAVSPRFGSMPSLELLEADFHRVLAGTLDLDERLASKEASYERSRPEDVEVIAGRTVSAAVGEVRVLWFDDEATDASIVEVRAGNAVGLLKKVTAALERSLVDVRSARISTLGAYVVDAFYVTGADGRPIGIDQRPQIEAEIAAALAG